MVTPWTRLMEHANCFSSGQPHLRVQHGRCMPASDRMLCAQGWRSNTIYLYWFYWGCFSVELAVFSLRARHGDLTAVSGAIPLLRRCWPLYTPWSTLGISIDWQAHFENHGSRYCPSCLQNLRSWFLWYKTEGHGLEDGPQVKTHLVVPVWGQPETPALLACACFSTSFSIISLRGCFLPLTPTMEL